MAYSVADLCTIIKTCNEARVKSFEQAGLKLQFAGNDEPPPPRPPTPQELEVMKSYENDAFLENEKRVKSDYLANLRLSDPEAYEDLINRGELDDARKEPEGLEP